MQNYPDITHICQAIVDIHCGCCFGAGVDGDGAGGFGDGAGVDGAGVCGHLTNSHLNNRDVRWLEDHFVLLTNKHRHLLVEKFLVAGHPFVKFGHWQLVKTIF